MEQLLKQFSEWMRKAFTPAYQTEVENYLSQSQDLADLERRMLYIQRRGML